MKSPISFRNLANVGFLTLFTSVALGAKCPVSADLSSDDLIKIIDLVKEFELGLKQRDAEKAVRGLSDDVLFVNQRGRMFLGKEEVLERHRFVLSPAGPLASKPPADYKFIRIYGSSANGHARALVAWKYPSYDENGNAVSFSESDPQEGYFLFNFLKHELRWSIATLQNTPTLGLTNK